MCGNEEEKKGEKKEKKGRARSTFNSEYNKPTQLKAVTLLVLSALLIPGTAFSQGKTSSFQSLVYKPSSSDCIPAVSLWADHVFISQAFPHEKG